MPYPDYLGDTEVHVALLTFPPEGASLQLLISIDGLPTVTRNIDVQGTNPVVLNISCADCYSTTGTVALEVAYNDDPGSPTPVTRDTGFAVSSLQVQDGQMDDGAIVDATFTGLTPGQTYTISMWCQDPFTVDSQSFDATSSTESYTTSVEPAICSSTRYLVLRSPDGVHVAVRSK